MQKLQNSYSELIAYRPASLHTGSCWFVSYYSYDPQSESLKRKRIKLNHIDKISERRKYANELIKRINNNLAQGWNPFLDHESKRG
ncbi:MAG: hypothetical protein KAH17_08645 [Bacteroidales bacterium]|nr:hypothetical protein [Bacteroidales bacterium]